MLERRRRGQAAKRGLDLALAGTALVLTSPVAAAVAVLVRLRLGTPVVFAQDRPGLGERPFRLLKFRTMLDVRAPDGRLLGDEERLTPLGRWLRRTSLDEWPQLLNVLRGEMSLVGPRPLLMEYLPLYTEEQHRRHRVRPGLTGWAQVNGRNALTWDEKFAQDVWYVDNWSLRLDLVIIWRTLGAVLRGAGVAEPGQATVRRFDGPGEC
jgi:lipopolysaccharide/colanic/teichoic acid biosynthesis glycosyltransferase